jgi:rubrerythrin
MNFNKDILDAELQNLKRTEDAMFSLYTQMLKKLTNRDIRTKILFIQKQESEHRRMVAEIMNILSGH